MYAIYDLIQETWMKALGTEDNHLVRFIRVFEAEDQANKFLKNLFKIQVLDVLPKSTTNLYDFYEIRQVTITEMKVNAT